MSDSNPPTPPELSLAAGAPSPTLSCPRCGAPQPDSNAPAPCPACLMLVAQEVPSPLGVSFEPPSVQEVGDALPAYEVQMLVGQGGMGAVYRARHRKLDRLVAIKVLRPMSTDDEAEAAAFTERFEREAQVLAKLDHPHIVRIYDFGHSDGSPSFFYLVLEFVDGASLRELMQSGRLTNQEALALIPQVCEALHTAHSLGVVHRDIKPENILVDGDGRVRIADFGLAKLTAGNDEALPLTQTNQAFGTLHYMAPEQMRSSGRVDHRADLYSLGVVLYELLTGELPLGRFAAPSARSGANEDIDEVVFKALAAEPSDRYQAAGDIKNDLESTGARGAAVQKESREGENGSRRLRTSKRRRARERARFEREFGEHAGAAAEMKLDGTRTWLVAVTLFLLHSMTWIDGPRAESMKVSEMALNSNTSFVNLRASISGLRMVALGVPLVVGLLALFIGGVLKDVIKKDARADPKWVYRNAHVGTILTCVCFLQLILSGEIKWLTAPGYLALGLYLVNSWKEHTEYHRLRVYRRLYADSANS